MNSPETHLAAAGAKLQPEVAPRYRYQRSHSLQRRYGITAEQYDELLASQGGKCAICATAPADHRPLAVDHDHLTGKVRGILCHSCNGGLGVIERPGFLVHALLYLMKHGTF